MSVKRVDSKAVYKLVSRFDDALETEVIKEEGKPDYNSPAGFDKYLETFDSADLTFKPDLKPTYFHVRCLKASELAEINEKYQSIDVVNKKVTYKSTNLMMIEIFDKTIIGVQDGDSPLEKVTSDDVGFHVATEVGSMISLMSTLGKNLKKA